MSQTGRHAGASRRRRLARLVVIAPMVLAMTVAVALPASAHAELERTSPAPDSVLKASPRLISLTFDEGVFPARDAIHLYDDRLTAVHIGSTFHPGGVGKVAAATVPPSLRVGTYTVVWRVTSDDGHVVAGQFAFSVGHVTEVRGAAPGTRHDAATSVLAAIARGLGYAGLVTGPGALVIMAWLWPAGLARRRMRKLLYAGGGLLILGAALAVVVQGAAATGVSVGDAFNGADLRLGMAGHFGRAMAGRLVLSAGLLWLAVAGVHRRGRVPAMWVSVAALALAAMWPYAGHAAAGDLVPLAFAADWVHVAATATWLGGLVVLLVGPLRLARDADAVPEAFVMLAGFSEWALNAVTLLVTTGLFAAWRNVREAGALPATHYGRLLLWKSGVVVAVLVVARVSRRHAEGLDRRGDAPLPALRRAVLAETGGAVVVLGITAFLTGSALAAQTYAPALTRSATDDGTTVTVHVDRTGVGAAHLVVSTTRADRAQPISNVEGTLSEVDPPVGPIPVAFRADGSGREIATVTFPDAGEWSLSLEVETSSAQRIAVATTIRVRG